jgi:predicted acyl esterase
MAHESHDVEVVHDLHIPMRDGVRPAANLYRPAGGGRTPCLVNYLPYHKDDGRDAGSLSGQDRVGLRTADRSRRDLV